MNSGIAAKPRVTAAPIIAGGMSPLIIASRVKYPNNKATIESIMIIGMARTLKIRPPKAADIINSRLPPTNKPKDIGKIMPIPSIKLAILELSKELAKYNTPKTPVTVIRKPAIAARDERTPFSVPPIPNNNHLYCCYVVTMFASIDTTNEAQLPN
ncbi:MAG: hypothetical protein F7C09_00265 [Aeropyrum sp.]|nr:hypothetical protein [Aeropyrum sp.]